jgi:hypothetical protein
MATIDHRLDVLFPADGRLAAITAGRSRDHWMEVAAAGGRNDPRFPAARQKNTSEIQIPKSEFPTV